jgi:recombination protein RecA
VTKSGSFFSYGEDRLGQGRNNAKAFLNEHPEIAKEIEDKIYHALGIDRDGVQPIDGSAVPEGVDPVTGEIAA